MKRGQVNNFAEQFGNFHEDEIVSINDLGDGTVLCLARKTSGEDETERRVIRETYLTCEGVLRRALRSGDKLLQWDLLGNIEWLDVIHLVVDEAARLVLNCEGQLAELPYESYVIEIDAARVKVAQLENEAAEKSREPKPPI